MFNKPEPHGPIALEFATLLREHGTATYSTEDSYRQVGVYLITKATWHKELCERACNVAMEPFEELAHQHQMSYIEQAVARVAEEFGAEAIFQHDPRGATIKLLMPDGFVNGFANEAMLVPTWRD